MYIQRQLEQSLQLFLKRREAIAIIGPRQAGKTTFITHLGKELEKDGKKVKLVTFENLGDLNLFQDSLEDFKSLAQEYDCVIIDEFQYAKNAGQKLKYLYDTTETKFIVSGSSSLELTFQTGKYMVGRMLEFKLMPFSFREYLSVNNSDFYKLLSEKVDSRSIFDFKIKNGFGDEINRRLAGILEKYVVWGGYPACVLSRTEDEKRKVMGGIVEKYLLQDISGLLHLATSDELMKMSRFLAVQIGNLVNYSELAEATGLSHREVLKHVSILEKTFILDMVRPFFANRRTELVKNPKNYFCDLGVRNFLISDFRPLDVRNDAGSVMENYAYNMLLNSGVAARINFWRTKSQAEVDFIIGKEGGVYPIEVKYGSKKTIGKSFYNFIEKYNPKIGIILTKDYLSEEIIGKTKIKFIP
ncbi:MAG: ATP-binding protein, partial [Candidatus Pacebacteria bacterium]|nr:ATP-binding protein [Candidatus Paceibacterota bacterium]